GSLAPWPQRPPVPGLRNLETGRRLLHHTTILGSFVPATAQNLPADGFFGPFSVAIPPEDRLRHSAWKHSCVLPQTGCYRTDGKLPTPEHNLSNRQSVRQTKSKIFLYDLSCQRP